MKRNLLCILILCIGNYWATAQEFVVEDYLGISCLKHTVSPNETFYQVAQRYFVRPSTLSMVNGIEDVENIKNRPSLYVPLTETNFYKSKGLNDSKFTFKPVYYKVVDILELDEIAGQFFVSAVSLKDWNAQSLPIKQGQKLIVGWLKYENDLQKMKTPLFVKVEKSIYGNEDEKKQARSELASVSLSKPIQEFADYSIPAQRRTVKNFEPSNEVANTSSISLKKGNEITERNSPEVKVEKASDPVSVKREVPKKEELTSKEKAFLSKEKRPKQEGRNKQDGIWDRVKKMTQNSYARDKKRDQKFVKEYKTSDAYSQKEVVNKAVPDQEVKTVTTPNETMAKRSKKRIIVKKKKKVAISKKVVENKKEELKQSSISKVKASDVVPVIEENIDPVEPPKPEIIENEMIRLTLLKNINGRVSFFYSGQAGAKFYVFTNLAGKGGIIKLTNRANNKFILAKVIGPLPEEDRRRGYIVKLSDNTRRVLSVKAKSFSAKVNY